MKVWLTGFLFMLTACADSGAGGGGSRLSADAAAELEPAGEAAALAGVKAAAIFPQTVTVEVGSTSDQPLSVLATNAQTGTMDDWDSYVEFYGEGTGFRGIFDLSAPADIDRTRLTKLTLQANFKGPDSSYQTWTWSLWDFTTSAWVVWGDNRQVAPWQWSLLSFSQTTGLGRFFDANGRARIRYQTVDMVDASDVDYVALIVEGETLQTTPTPTPAPTPAPAGTWWRPTAGLTWQIQYSGTLNESLPVAVYNIDLEETPKAAIDRLHAAGKKVICYISGGGWEEWRSDKDKFPASVVGNAIDGWPGERWLDIRQIAILKPIMTARMDMAKAKGCDGLDPDLVEGYTYKNTGFPLTYADQIRYNKMLAAEAHARGLAIGLKNDLGQIPDLIDDFDFQTNEQCFEYSECATLSAFIQRNKPVFHIEYTGTPSTLCPRANKLGLSTIFKKLNLNAYRVSCQ